MNVRLFGFAAAAMMAAMGAVACGDDTGGEGGSGGASASTGTPGTGGDSSPASNGSSSSKASSSTGEGAGEPGTGGGGAGEPGTGGAGGGTGGGGDLLPCEEVCAADPGCDLDPVEPDEDGECAACIGEERDLGIGSSCAPDLITEPCCAENDACSEYVTCTLSNGDNCEDNEEGYERARVCLYEACGACGSPE